MVWAEVLIVKEKGSTSSSKIHVLQPPNSMRVKHECIMSYAIYFAFVKTWNDIVRCDYHVLLVSFQYNIIITILILICKKISCKRKIKEENASMLMRLRSYHSRRCLLSLIYHAPSLLHIIYRYHRTHYNCEYYYNTSISCRITFPSSFVTSVGSYLGYIRL